MYSPVDKFAEWAKQNLQTFFLSNAFLPLIVTELSTQQSIFDPPCS